MRQAAWPAGLIFRADLSPIRWTSSRLRRMLSTLARWGLPGRGRRATRRLRAADGRWAWHRSLPSGGVLELSQGLIFPPTADSLHAFAPAERTYSMAIDSPHGTDYPPDHQPSAPGPERNPSSGAAPPPGDALSDEFAPISPRQPPADATILRLRWPGDLPALLRQAAERRRTVGELPLLVEIDWVHPA